MSPVFSPKRQIASYEATFEVSSAPLLEFAVRVRNPARPDAVLRLQPDEVTLCYAYRDGRWAPSGIEVKGMAPDRTSPLVARFTPDPDFEPLAWDKDTPQWALDLVTLMAPVRPPR